MSIVWSSFFSRSNIVSITMNVPVRPTPFLCVYVCEKGGEGDEGGEDKERRERREKDGGES